MSDDIRVDTGADQTGADDHAERELTLHRDADDCRDSTWLPDECLVRFDCTGGNTSPSVAEAFRCGE